MHETSSQLFRKLIHGVERRSVLVCATEKDIPHSFGKNLLTRDQLNQLFDLNEVKTIIKNRKRSLQPSEEVLKKALIR